MLMPSLLAGWTNWATLSRWRIAGLAFVFLWFLLGGIAHFALTSVEMRIMPPWIAWPHAAVIVSGVCELLGAAGLIWWRTRRAAGIGLFALTVAVIPANIYMLQHYQLFDIPYWVLVARLPVQLALLALIAWSTIARPATTSTTKQRPDIATARTGRQD